MHVNLCGPIVDTSNSTKKTKRRDDSLVAVGVNVGVVSSSTFSKCTRNLEMGITRIRGPLKAIASFNK